jgi:hypothetical protein
MSNEIDAKPYFIVQTIDPKRVSDLLCSAFEGGSNYWVKSGRREGFEGYLSDVALHEGATVFIKTIDDDKELKLDRLTILNGLQLMMTKQPRHFGDFLAENDDADTADVFLQLALFGEMIYG